MKSVAQDAFEAWDEAWGSAEAASRGGRIFGGETVEGDRRDSEEGGESVVLGEGAGFGGLGAKKPRRER